jgi:hypothetical protein
MEETRPTITTNHFPKDKLEILTRIIDNSEGTDSITTDIVRKNVGGICIICHGIPAKKLTYQMGGIIKIEWYCDKCFTKSGIQ